MEACSNTDADVERAEDARAEDAGAEDARVGGERVGVERVAAAAGAAAVERHRPRTIARHHHTMEHAWHRNGSRLTRGVGDVFFWMFLNFEIEPSKKSFRSKGQ